MRTLFILSKDNPDISRFELERVIGKKVKVPFKGIAVSAADDSCIELLPKLAYTNSAYKILFTAEKRDKDSLIKKMQRFSWQKHYAGDFCLKIKGMGNEKLSYSLPALADIVWRRLEGPKVNLKSPRTVFEMIIADRIYACKLVWQNTKEYNKRKPHMRPMLHPSSLSPKLARACVNMTGLTSTPSSIIRRGSSSIIDISSSIIKSPLLIKSASFPASPGKIQKKKPTQAHKAALLDPFCGTGGFLIEAALMGFRAEGIDIEGPMIKRARANLLYYGIKDFSLRKGDALKLKGQHPYVATDLPYGKNTKKCSYDALYRGFLHTLERVGISGAVVIFPDFIDYKKMLRSAGKLKIVKEFDYYIHKSMTKKIVVLASTHHANSVLEDGTLSR